MHAPFFERMLARGKERGYLTYDDLNAVLPDQVSVEDVMGFLSEQGITVLEDEGALMRVLAAIYKLVVTYRQMMHEIGREPTSEELAAKLVMPLDKVCRLLALAKEPIELDLSDLNLSDPAERKLADVIFGTRAASQSVRVPNTTEKLLYLLLPKREREVCIDELYVEYRDKIVPKFGEVFARRWYAWQATKLIGVSLLKQLTFGFVVDWIRRKVGI